jgi:putative addiction module component (TIGR02574 family)
VPAEPLPPLSDEWIAEIQRRSAEYDSGAGETVPWDQVRTETLRRIGVTLPDAAN